MSQATVDDPRAELYRQACAFAAAGIPIALTALAWNPAAGKKQMDPTRRPPVGWQHHPVIGPDEIRARIEQGATAFLYRLPDDVWVLDSDTPESVAWARQFGPPTTVTPRGEHRLFRGPARAVMPAHLPETSSDAAVRQLYGPGSFYLRPGQPPAVYAGAVPDFAAVPPMPEALRGDLSAPEQPVTGLVVPESPIDRALREAARPAPVTKATAGRIAREKLTAIATGPLAGETARSTVRDAALYLGGLLHADWFDTDNARAQLVAACTARWGAPDEDDLKWIEQGLADGDRPAKRLPIAAEFFASETPPIRLDEHGQRIRKFGVLSGPQPARPPVPMLVAGWVPDRAVVRIFGAPGSLKSFVALDWALSVATGTPWLGCPVQQRDVLYVVAEGAYEFHKRIRAWCVAHSVGWPSALHLIEAAPQMSNPEDIEDLRLTVDELNCGLIILDTQARTTIGMNENAAQDAGLIQSAWDRIRGEKATLAIVTHAGHDSDRARGSSSFLGAVDAEIRVNRPRRADLVAVLSVAKMKDGADDRVVTVVANRVPLGPDETSLALAESQLSDRDDLTNGAGHVAPEAAYDRFDVRPVGVELETYDGPGKGLVAPLAQLMAQRAPGGSSGVSRMEASTLLGRLTKDGAVRRAWDVLWQAGALTPATGSRTPTGRCWWIEPGAERGAELVRRLL